MNSSIYVFGNLGNGYEQYPNDDTKNALQSLYERATTDSQMVVHRDDNKMYYGYIQKLYDRSQYIGFCIVLDGVMFSNGRVAPIEDLFSAFYNAVKNLAKSKVMLEYNERGNIFSRVSTLAEAQGEVKRIITTISYDIKSLEYFTMQLPPVSSVVMNEGSKTIYIGEARPQEMEKAIAINSYTYILRGKGGDAISYSSHKETIEYLEQEIGKRTSAYVKLKEEYEKQSKKFTSWVVVLVIICCILAGLLLYVKFF